MLQKLALLSEELGLRADKHYAEILTIRSKISDWSSVTSQEMSKSFMLRYTTLSCEYQFKDEWFDRALGIYKNMEKTNSCSKVVQLLKDMANYYVSDEEMSMQCIADAFEMHKGQNEATSDDTTIDLLDSLFRIFTRYHEDGKAACYISAHLKS